MLDSLSIAATGMQAQQLNIDSIANNLANVNTTGFKKTRVDFADLMYRPLNTGQLLPGAELNGSMGLGAAIARTEKVFSDGDLKQTERPFDIAIQGEGFFEVMLPDGSYGYTRTGAFRTDSDGMLVTADGYLLNPSVQLPNDTEQLVVKSDGTVLAQLAGERRALEVGRLELAKFSNPGELRPVGDNLYLPTHESGDAYYARPGESVGTLSQGYLETSNVKLVEELTNLVLAQRAYEINAKVVQASDEMMGIVNGLRR